MKKKPQVKVKKISDHALLPKYANDFATGADVCSTVEALIEPGQRKLIPTGLKFELPPNYEMQVRPRSGLALKNGITIVNTPGSIDNDYRGEVGIILINHGTNWFKVDVGMRIAQLVIAPYVQATFKEVKELNDTERGTNGYGSTGT